MDKKAIQIIKTMMDNYLAKQYDHDNNDNDKL